MKPNASNYDIIEHVSKARSRENSASSQKMTGRKESSISNFKNKEEIQVKLDTRNQANKTVDVNESLQMNSQVDSAAKSSSQKDLESPKAAKKDNESAQVDVKRDSAVSGDVISVTDKSMDKSVDVKNTSEMLVDPDNNATIFSNRAESIDSKVKETLDKEKVMDQDKS